jgi:hypothetical protein
MPGKGLKKESFEVVGKIVRLGEEMTMPGRLLQTTEPCSNWKRLRPNSRQARSGNDQRYNLNKHLS